MTLQQRGRQSSESKLVVKIASTRMTPKAPIRLSKAAAELWGSITESLPVDFFRAGDLPLLEAYVVSATRKHYLDDKVNKEGIMYDGVPHPAIKISRDEATLMASLAVKLRLCQSSRTRPDSASLNVVHTGKRPWD